MGDPAVVWHSTRCMPCERVKEYLAQKNVAFVTRNISEDDAARDAFIAKGFMSVPVTELNGQTIIGYDVKQLDAAIRA